MQCGRTEVLMMGMGQAGCFSCKVPSHEEGDMGQPSPRVITTARLRDLGGYKGKLPAMSVLQLSGTQESQKHMRLIYRISALVRNHPETEARAAEMPVVCKAQGLKFSPQQPHKKAQHGCIPL